MKLSFTIKSASFLLFLVLFQPGCKTICESIPTERSPRLRIVNAMPDEAKVMIYLDGKLLNAAYPYVFPADFGYTNHYADDSLFKVATTRSDKKQLVVLSESRDTLIKDSIPFPEARQSLFILGRGKPELASTRKIILFNDELTVPDQNTNLIRFVDALTDLPALDVYFTGDLSTQPAFTLHYGDTMNLYRRVSSFSKLVVTESGHPNHIIFSSSNISLQTGFFVTILLEGETTQVGMEPLVSEHILSDDPVGRSLIPFYTFGVRSINATRRNTDISLMPAGPLDKGPRNDITGQFVVMNIPRDSVSDWAPFNPTTHGGFPGAPVEWDWSNLVYPADTVYLFHYVASADVRYSFILMDTATLASGQEKLDSMTLTDTIAPPASNMGKLRIVNLSPDHTVSFTIGGNQVTLGRRGVTVIDLPPGHYAPTESSTGTTLDITVPAGIPEGLFFFPSTSSSAVPYSVAKE